MGCSGRGIAVGRSRSPETVTRFIMAAWRCPSLAPCKAGVVEGGWVVWSTSCFCHEMEYQKMDNPSGAS